ncbi:flagellar protein FliT [Pleionea sediminis]|uniref:flagellar protein FliT n=1 Tax=Pleionea sediminis TaxID=2569479 RepID=UPI0011862487|nr:flagellar protein FliT [Pleionea sediminis]
MPTLSEAIDLTKSIELYIIEEQWDKVVEVTVKRQKILENYFSQKPLADSDEKVAEAINFILESDKTNKRKIDDLKSDEVKDALNLKRQFNVANAYAKNE